MKVQDLTREFNQYFGTSKPETAIRSALRNHNIRCGRKPKDRLMPRRRLLTKDQEQFICDNYTTLGVKELALLLKHHFKINKTAEQIKTYVTNHNIKSGRTGCFKKGHIPANKGTKGLTGANPGSFKKGNTPPNRRPVGSERICSKNGFILIKIAEQDPYTGFPTRWKAKHVHTWEQINGFVPDGMVVAFIDGNQLNWKVDNLMLISRAELLNLNQNRYKDAPARIKPNIMALYKLQVKIFAKEKTISVE